MKFNFTKFTLPALLIAASATAFAEEEAAVVTLANGAGTVTWSQFVTGLNNPPTVTDKKGNISDLPANNSAKVNYDAAKKKVDADEQDLATKKAAVLYDKDATEHPKLVQDSLDAQSDVNSAKAAMATIDQNVIDTKKAYDDAEAQLAEWQTQYNNYQKDATKASNLISQYNLDLDDANAELKKAQDAYDAAKVTTTTTTYPEWIEKAKENVEAFSANYEAMVEEQSYTDMTIYYKWSDATGYFTLAFSEDQSDNTFKSVTISKFSDLITETIGGVSEIDQLRIYFGAKADGTYNYTGTGGYVKAPISGKRVTSVINAAYDAIDNIYKASAETTTTTTYNDPDGTLKKALDDAQTEVNTITTNRNSARTALQTANKNSADTEALIDGYTTTIVKDNKTQQQLLKDAWDDAVDKQTNSTEATTLANAESDLAKATDALKTARAAVTAAEQKLATDQETLDNYTTLAQAEADQLANDAATAAARAAYNEVELIGDVTASTAINNFSGTIHGDGHVITVTAPYLFSTLNGNAVLSELAINGKTYRATAGGTPSYTNVARWNNGATDSTKGAFYGDGKTTECETLGELGYAARAMFGVNFTDNQLVAKADNSIVYKLTVNQQDGTNPTQYVVVDDEGEMENAAGAFTLPVNTFAQSATADIANRGVANVYYGTNNTCDKVVIVDKENFYCPVNINAKEVTYNRSFMNSATIDGTDYYGFNAVCLPFALNTSIAGENEDIRSISVFERVNEKAKSFHFTQTDNATVPAYTPILVLVNKGRTIGESLSLTNVNIEKTDKQVVVYEGATDDESVAYGTVTNTNRGLLNGYSNSAYIYGLNSNGKFQAASATAKVSAFRMMIGTKADVMNPKSAMKSVADYIDEYSISIFDEEGRDILAFDTPSAGIDNIAADTVDAITVAGGQGEIIITAKADFGKVEIYNLNGMLIDVVDVVEGTTSVGVSKGYYIVMGQKVMVK